MPSAITVSQSAPCASKLTARPLVRRSASRRRIAERIGRAVTAFETHLVRAVFGAELDAEFRIEPKTAIGVRVAHDLKARNPVRVELRIPRAVKRIGEVHALAVAADLRHLRPAAEWSSARMLRVLRDAADANASRKPRLHRIGHVVLAQFAGPPARDVEEAIVERQVDVAHQWRDRTEPLQERRQIVGIGRFRRDRHRLLRAELSVALAIPREDRRFEIRGVDDDADEAVFANRIVRGTHFERHLVVRAEVDRLHVLARPQIPEVQRVAVSVRQQVFGDEAVLELRRQAPLARHHVIARQIPPEVVMQLLRTAIDLPFAEDLEALAIEDENARHAIGAVLAGAAERAPVDAFGAAVNGVWTRIAGPAHDLVRFDDLDDARAPWIGLRIDHVQPRRAYAGNDQIATLEERVSGHRRERRRAR